MPQRVSTAARAEADAAALNFQVGRKLASTLHAGKVTLPEKLFLELPLAVAVRKGRSADLIAKLDRGIAAIRADGTWQRIDQRWAANNRRKPFAGCEKRRP